MIPTKKPSGQFGIWREPGGGFRLEFYRPDGLMTSRTVFDAEAAREFLDAVSDVVRTVDDEHEHQWIGATTYGDRDIVEWCLVPGCDSERRTQRGQA